jgi:hypothetical protein
MSTTHCSEKHEKGLQKHMKGDLPRHLTLNLSLEGQRISLKIMEKGLSGTLKRDMLDKLMIGMKRSF